MAKILKCPRCQERIDVTDLSGGSTVKCEACGTMVRLSTGSTGKVPVSAPPPPPPAAPAKKERTTKVRTAGAGGGRQTDLFRKMSNARAPGEKGRSRGGGGGGRGEERSNAGMIIAIAAGAIVVIGGLAYAVMSGKNKEQSPSKVSGTRGEGREAGSSGKKKSKDEPHRTVQPAPVAPSDSGVFKPGARGLANVGKDVPDMGCNAASKQTYEEMAGSGKTADIVGQDYTWITYVIDGLLSDNENVCKGSMDALHQIIVKRKLDAKMSDLAKSAIIGGFNMPEMRSGEYSYWAQWWFTKSARDAVAGWREEGGASAAAEPGAPRVAAGNASTEPWEETLKKCRSGGFSNSSNPEYYEFQRIKGMGKSAYPHLIRFIDNEDTSLGTTAVLILKELSGRSEAPGRVTEANKAKIKEDWEGWLKSGP